MNFNLEKSKKLFEEIKEPLGKVLLEISKDKEKILYGQSRKSITAQSLDSAIGNHMCDDHPEWFGISELEGHKIREYFQYNGLRYGWRDYIMFLHESFPELMDKENPEYLEITNEQRKDDGLSPINF